MKLQQSVPVELFEERVDAFKRQITQTYAQQVHYMQQNYEQLLSENESLRIKNKRLEERLGFYKDQGISELFLIQREVKLADLEEKSAALEQSAAAKGPMQVKNSLVHSLQAEINHWKQKTLEQQEIIRQMQQRLREQGTERKKSEGILQNSNSAGTRGLWNSFYRVEHNEDYLAAKTRPQLPMVTQDGQPQITDFFDENNARNTSAMKVCREIYEATPQQMNSYYLPPRRYQYIYEH